MPNFTNIILISGCLFAGLGFGFETPGGTSGIIGGMSLLKRFLVCAWLFSLVACSGGTPNFPAVLPSPTPLPLTVTLPPPTVTPVPQALVVNGEGLTFDEFNAELARYQAAYPNASAEQARQAVSDNFVAQLLLAQGAAEAGFTLDEVALQQRLDNLASQAGGADKLSAWQQAHGYSQESFRVALQREAAAAWMRDKIAATVPSTAEQVHVRQILLYNEDVAKNYQAQLQAGADFDELAAQVDPATRGDLGWFPRGYLPEQPVEAAAFALEPGQVSAIVPSQAGFHLLKLLARETDRPLAPDALQTLQSRVVAEWVASRRQVSTIQQTP